MFFVVLQIDQVDLVFFAMTSGLRLPREPSPSSIEKFYGVDPTSTRLSTSGKKVVTPHFNST